MSGKMKGIIGGVAGAVLILILVLVFSGGGSITPQEFAKETMGLANNVVTKLETAQSKEDIKSLYKETASSFLDMVPGALVGAKEYVESKGGIEKIKQQAEEGPDAFMATYSEEFKDVIAEAMPLGAKISALGNNRGFQDRMETIFESLTDLDYTEMVNFTITEVKTVIEEVANDSDALEALNWYVKLVTPEFEYEYGEEKQVWIEDEWYEDGGYWDWRPEETKVPVTPVTVTKEMLLTISSIIETETAGIKSEKDFNKSMGRLERKINEHVGSRVVDF